MIIKLSERAKKVQNKLVDPRVDNMLSITNDGRKIGLDQRLMNNMLPDDPHSKVNLCMENIYRIWEETADKRLTQLCFCDSSTPNKDGRFNVYTDIKNKLIAKGVPKNEIAFIHDANSETKKEELFAKVRSGKVRVLLGSTQKMGTGTNVQNLLYAIHDLDLPWRPDGLTQRAGRGVRQFNTNPEVNIFRYVTEGTFDAYMLQTLEVKQKFIGQIMTSKSPVRSCDDIDEVALSYAEIKALCTGNPLIREKMDLDVEVARLMLLKSDHKNQSFRLQDDILQRFPRNIKYAKESIKEANEDIATLEASTHKSEKGISPMKIGNKIYTDRGEAGAALIKACKSSISTDGLNVGSYRGFSMFISYDTRSNEFHCNLQGRLSHNIVLGNDSFGNITRINNTLEKIPERLYDLESRLQTLNNQMESAKTELAKPFPFEKELATKSARLTELDTLLNMDGKFDSKSTQEVVTKQNSEPIQEAKPTEMAMKF